MHKELTYMTDILDKKGLREGDILTLRPFGLTLLMCTLLCIDVYCCVMMCADVY